MFKITKIIPEYYWSTDYKQKCKTIQILWQLHWTSRQVFQTSSPQKNSLNYSPFLLQAFSHLDTGNIALRPGIPGEESCGQHCKHHPDHIHGTSRSHPLLGHWHSYVGTQLQNKHHNLAKALGKSRKIKMDRTILV